MVVVGMPSFFDNVFEEILPLGVSRIFKIFLSMSDKFAPLLPLLILSYSY